MDGNEWLAERFTHDTGRLRAVAYRMLGSLSEADDAVQEAWLRLSRTDADAIQNLSGWLTTVVGRVCLDMLRSRAARREDSYDGEAYVPEPVVDRHGAADPEHQALTADSVGLALLVVLEALSPAERLAFVLHDMFGVPFEEIAPVVDRTPAATRQLASRARRRVRGSAPTPDADLARQRAVVEAFLLASRAGDFDALVAVLDPDVVLRSEYDPESAPVPPSVKRYLRGARKVASQAALFGRGAGSGTRTRIALVNGAIGVVTTVDGRLHSVLGFTVTDGRIAEIDIQASPERLRHVDPAFLDE
ncbi:sigma-70 family RNA polymerase sigma factor [Streptomyces fuscigenes]|uniref:sigma-70 family RNA polymerase sigma factor n=1 Tax=Streptomyces fuscigenes TaxID=1528880 RepID=UPI001F2E4737|nr:sigma-70 family RNA polymerase sigma factor [Streptomyces fuscigenes]MCF3961979.1 sigma-70 family RNA polymerase sigma factor [Streptomyces fuscigenes]